MDSTTTVDRYLLKNVFDCYCGDINYEPPIPTTILAHEEETLQWLNNPKVKHNNIVHNQNDYCRETTDCWEKGR